VHANDVVVVGVEAVVARKEKAATVVVRRKNITIMVNIWDNKKMVKMIIT